MTEYETDPQRPGRQPGGEQPHPTVEPPQGQSESAPAVSPYAAPGAPPAQEPPIWQPAEPATAQHPAEPVTQQQPAVAPTTGPPAAGPWHPGQQHPGQQHQPVWPGNAGYGVPPQPPYPGGPQAAGAPQPFPAWAQPVATQAPPRPRRGRKILATGAAALMLALASGGVGAWTALAFDDDGSTPATQTASSSTTRVVDRSSLAQIAAKVQDSVVSIGAGNGEGSGVVLTADGYVLTNNHVVASAQGDTVRVVFANGKSATAKIVGTDPRTDLAVVKADGVSDLSAAQFGNSGDMQVGDTVLALGSPLGLQGSVTAGIISAKDRTIQTGGQQQDGPLQRQSSGVTSMSGLLQTDAPINPGNSGGALVNTAGEIIGINTAIATSGQSQGNIGVGFAIPSNRASQVANQLMKGQKVSHPALGVSVDEADGGGALVRSVTPGSAAEKAGLKQGDVITGVDGKPVNDSDDLISIVQNGKVGDQVQVSFTRNGATQQVTATLAEAP